MCRCLWKQGGKDRDKRQNDRVERGPADYDIISERGFPESLADMGENRRLLGKESSSGTFEIHSNLVTLLIED
jgi:hypothetical protein